MARTSRRDDPVRDARVPVRSGLAATSEGAAALVGCEAGAGDVSPTPDTPGVVPARSLSSEETEAPEGAVASPVSGAVPALPSAPYPAARPGPLGPAPADSPPLGPLTADPGPGPAAGPAATSGTALV